MIIKRVIKLNTYFQLSNNAKSRYFVWSFLAVKLPNLKFLVFKLVECYSRLIYNEDQEEFRSGD